MLSVKNIIKKFHDKKILDDVSFAVKPGEIAVLLGQSGVGKSTMLRVLSNLESIDSGSLMIEEQKIDFKKVGMVFQDFNLFSHLTVKENLVVPLVHVALKQSQEAEEVAMHMLASFNVLALADFYPVSLSGGQKQRVALARALCLNPRVLCLDEPTSALDPLLTLEVAKIIMSLADRDMIIVIATHDLGLLSALKCTIHLMAHGKIIESASSQQLANCPESFVLINNFVQGK